MASTDERVTLGKLGKVHGLKGWLRLHSYTNPPENIANYQQFQACLGSVERHLELDDIRQQGESYLAHFTGIDQPEQAQELVGADLQVDREALPGLEANEYYWHQLQGLKVVNQQAQCLGYVDRLLETGANDVLVVTPGQDSIDDHERLIPYLFGTVVQQVNLDRREISVDWEPDFLI